MNQQNPEPKRTAEGRARLTPTPRIANNIFAENPNLQVTAARELAKQKHAGQKRENGQDYFLAHIEPVAHEVEANYLKYIPEVAHNNWNQPLIKSCVVSAAYLHDALEGTDLTVNDLKSAGYLTLTIELVEMVTKKPNEEYFDFIMRIHNGGRPLSNPCGPFRVGGVAIKLADLENNLLISKKGARRDKYKLAQYILSYFNRQ